MKAKIKKIINVPVCGDGCCHGDILLITVNGEEHSFKLDSDPLQEVEDLVAFMESINN